ncbi:ribosome biogenesis GTPase Der [Amorphus orientalis]|uniref:GTPase Der n=1 Tax=Amorphus orientalis TaxID=649198 RepID=A0AAE3VP75_9HYPH|nr:ribosome biogenesis GTPase Der [Amorphus orientalis]MDQ0315605.1 GTP-binding protein [Amorphus orientalis]
MDSGGTMARVAIVGRPNVGKSTLFNRLIGKRLALVDDTPGVTRDRREGQARIADLRFTVIDTAGLEDAGPQSLEGRMREQTDLAIAAADVILFVIDARAGVMPADQAYGELLRRSSHPVIVLANKAEGRAGDMAAMEAYSLGLGEPITFSAEHGQGLDALYDMLKAAIDALASKDPAADATEDGTPDPDAPETDAPAEDEEGPGRTRPVQVAVVGRPNAGKSTLINRLLGEERMLTGPEAGITRDSIAVDWEWRGRAFRLIDTAGMRRKAKVQEKLERMSVGESIRALKFAEVVVVTIDATVPFEKQDLHIIDLVVREGRAMVIALDKWDLVKDPEGTLKALREMATRLLPQIRGVQMIPVSGLTGRGLDRLLEAVVKSVESWSTRVSTGRLNRWFHDAITRHPPPAVSGRRIKLRYITQAKTRPPHFIAFCSMPEEMPEAYKRYLINGLRDTFDLGGVPIRLTLRKGDNPYA